MPPMRIVPALNELKHCSSSFFSRAKSATIQQLAFKSCKETLAERVVVAISNRSHRRPDACFPTTFSESKRCVLTALIRVVNYSFRPPLPNCHLQSVIHKFSTQMVGHTCTAPHAVRCKCSPAHHPSAPGIHIVPILAQPPPDTRTRPRFEHR